MSGRIRWYITINYTGPHTPGATQLYVTNGSGQLPQPHEEMAVFLPLPEDAIPDGSIRGHELSIEWGNNRNARQSCIGLLQHAGQAWWVTYALRALRRSLPDLMDQMAAHRDQLDQLR